MKILHTLRNYFLYCGIEKEEYNLVKKDAYISNFRIWRVLHFLMAAVFGGLFLGSLYNDLMKTNRMLYLSVLIYLLFAIILFFILKEDSLVAQLVIYLSISLLFIFGILITGNRPDYPAVTFIVFLLISSMFMIDKPFFMAFELCAASALFLVWMYYVKPIDVWLLDRANVITFTLVGIFLNIIANSIRIKEFVLTRQLNIQKDTDYLTGLLNKGAISREIRDFFEDETKNKGMLFLLDVDHFKSINDTYGHDAGDAVIKKMGAFLEDMFPENALVGRFGGDEFMVFIKDTNDRPEAEKIAEKIIAGASDKVEMPGNDGKISVSVGIALYSGEGEFSHVFKMADTALYRSKDRTDKKYTFYE